MPQVPWFRRGATLGVALHGTALHLTVLNTLRYEHYLSPPIVTVVAAGTVRTRGALELQAAEPSGPGGPRRGTPTPGCRWRPWWCASGAETVVDLGTQGVQRHATLAVPLAAAHLGTAETTGALDADALGAGLAGGLHSLAHGATESDAALELLGNGLGDEVGVELGALDLDDLDCRPGRWRPSSSFLRRASTSAPFLPITTPGTSRGDDDLDLVACALDLDAWRRRHGPAACPGTSEWPSRLPGSGRNPCRRTSGCATLR